MLLRIAPLLSAIGLILTCSAQNLPDLALFLRFDHKPSPVFIQTMEKELGRILSPAIFRLHWVIGNDSRSYSRAMVITFHGACAGHPSGSEPTGSSQAILAETVTAEGRVFPFSDIDCDKVNSLLNDHAPGEESRLGRATGRVLAHELYHFLLQTSEHSKTGIGRAVHTPSALLSRSLRFEEGELEKIRSLYK